MGTERERKKWRKGNARVREKKGLGCVLNWCCFVGFALVFFFFGLECSKKKKTACEGVLQEWVGGWCGTCGGWGE